MATQDKRHFAASNFAIDIDGNPGGAVTSCSGGAATADVISETMGVTAYTAKHIANVSYPDITFKCGAAMSKSFYDWVKASFDMTYGRKNGAIINCDYNYKEVSRMTFFNALVKGVGFPALDASSKSSAQIDMTLGVEKTKYQTSPAGSISGKYNTANKQTKAWTCANFRLKMDGLDDVSSHVSKIDAIKLSQNTAVAAVGELRDTQIEPVSLTVPDLAITFSESVSDAMWAWHQSFVIDGKCGDDQEKGATLEFLTSDLKTVMFTLTFHHLGIYKMEPDPASTDSEDLKRVKATMYCEQIDFNYNSQFVVG